MFWPKTLGTNKGQDTGKWGWPGKSSRTLPSLMLEQLMVRNSPDGGQSLCWGSGPSSQAVGLISRSIFGSLSEGWHNLSASRKARLLGPMREQHVLYTQLSLSTRHRLILTMISCSSRSLSLDLTRVNIHSCMTFELLAIVIASLNLQVPRGQVPRLYNSLEEIILCHFRSSEGS